MPDYPLHPEEDKRLEALRSLGILDSPPEESYDDIVRLAADICEVPICLITFIDEERQWIKAGVGSDLRETPREAAFCAHGIVHGDHPMVVEDATRDDRFRNNPYVAGEPGIRFYAGSPLQDARNLPFGSLCVIDTVPKQLSDRQIFALKVLAGQVSQQLELRRLHRLLDESRKETELRNQSLKRLVQVISHDLRNPFNGLINISALLENQGQSLDPKDYRRLVSDLGESSRQAYSLLENLLASSSSEAGMIEFSPEAAYLADLVEQTAELLGPSFDRKDVAFTNRVDPELLVKVDTRMLAAVLRNLVSNALKFTRRGGFVELSAGRHDDFVEVAVRDNGVGLDPSQLEALKAHQLHRSTRGTAGEKGSGIGLGIVRDFLAAHGASFDIQSTPDEGTCVRFLLPRA